MGARPAFDEIEIVQMAIARVNGVRVVVKNLHTVRQQGARAYSYALPRRNDHIVADVNQITNLDRPQPAVAQQNPTADRSSTEPYLLGCAGAPRHRTQHTIARNCRTGSETLPNHSRFMGIRNIRQKHTRERERMRIIATEGLVSYRRLCSHFCLPALEEFTREFQYDIQSCISLRTFGQMQRASQVRLVPPFCLNFP
jgi:hypothetical protein